jgi:2-dehydropantoate 2-reductase
MTMMRVAVFGVGAMGCLFGARLSPHAEVTLVGHWQEQMAALNAHGLRLIRPDGDEERISLRATDDPAAIGEVALALILVKAAGTARAAQEAARILAPDGLAVTLQNGVGNAEVLAEHVGQARTTLGVTAQGAAVLEPGVIRHAGPGPTHLAARPEIRPRVEAGAALLTRAGFETHLADNLDSLVWGKLVINAGINALTAILRVPNGALLDSEWARRGAAGCADASQPDVVWAGEGD